MKKKDIAIIISGLLFVVLICIDGFLIFEQNLEKTNSEQFFKHNIVSKEEYVGYTYDSVKQINYYINNGNKYIAFDKETGNKKFEIEIKEEDLANIEFTAEDIIKLYSYKIDDEYKLFNINGELVRTSNNIIMISNDWHNNKSYYVYENSLYDEDNKLIYKDLFKGVDTSVFSFRFNVYGSYVIYTDDTKGKLINLKTNEVIDIISYYKMNKYVEIEIKNNYYYLDTEKDELNKYTKYEDSDLGRILYQGSDKYLYLNNKV